MQDFEYRTYIRIIARRNKPEKKLTEYFILLGSNLGDREDFINKAITAISQSIGTLTKSSSLYESSAWGKTNQPDFLNKIIIVKSSSSPFEVLKKLKEIEVVIGRIEREKWAEREIDLDILFADELVINDPILKIPHPGIPERRFTLEPLVELDKNKMHPFLSVSMQELLHHCIDKTRVKKI